MISGLKRDNAHIIAAMSTILLGSLVRNIRNVAVKQFIASLLGFTTVIMFCGTESLYSLVSVFIGTCLIKCGKRCHPRAVFVFSFLFRLFFCAADLFGFPRDENNLANAVQLVLTLKLISVAYEVRDYEIRMEHGKESEKDSRDNTSVANSKHATLPLVKQPSFYDIVCYMYCFLGIATGPFFRFRTYYDMIHMPYSVASSLPVRRFLAGMIFPICFCVFLLLCGRDSFNTDEITSDEFYEKRSFLYRLLYIIPCSGVHFCGYYFIWYLSECGCCCAGLGVYPYSHVPKPGRGPSVFTENKINWEVDKKNYPSIPEYSYECIINNDFIYGTTEQTFAKLFRSWNQTVQWWMAHFIYSSKIIPRNLILLRLIAVSLMSAMWHGLKAGYYFSFLGMVVTIFVEHISLDQIRGRLGKHGIAIYDAFHAIVFQLFGVGHFAVQFKISNYNHILRYLKSVYFGLYSILAVIAVVCFVLQLVIPNRDEENKKAKDKTQ